MGEREPIQVVEIDIDYCDLTYGQGACTAALGSTGERKCFNMYLGCQDKENFTSGTLTLKLCQPRPNLPKDDLLFPLLVSATPRSASVNIGGTDPRLEPLGRRATVSVLLNDIPYHDRFFDKYQAQRLSGAAQTDEGGYDPADRGTLLAKLRARWPYYAGREMRLIDAYLEDGVITNQAVRHYVMTNFKRSNNDQYVVDGKDVFDLASNDSAVLPKPSGGVLLSDIDDTTDTATLSPEGIGDAEYPATGRATIGSEVVDFTRVGDVLTFTGRGVVGTEASSHSAEDVVQETFSVSRDRVDDVIARIFTEGTEVSAEYLLLSEWAAEVTRWAPDLRLTANITAPTGVSKLLGELSVLGVNLWPYDIGKGIGLKMIRPVDGDDVFDATDSTTIKSMEIDDRDSDRITEVLFNSVMLDPTGSITDASNFARGYYAVNQDVKVPDAFGDTKIREVFCRWLDHGDDATVRIITKRMLNRLSTAPQRAKILLDADERAVNLTSVLNVTSRMTEDDTGQAVSQQMQVVSVEARTPGHDFYVQAQNYEYSGKFGFVTPNDMPTYTNASAAQIGVYAFAVDDTTLEFPDGAGPYRII